MANARARPAGEGRLPCVIQAIRAARPPPTSRQAGVGAAAVASESGDCSGCSHITFTNHYRTNAKFSPQLIKYFGNPAWKPSLPNSAIQGIDRPANNLMAVRTHIDNHMSLRRISQITGFSLLIRMINARSGHGVG